MRHRCSTYFGRAAVPVGFCACAAIGGFGRLAGLILGVPFAGGGFADPVTGMGLGVCDTGFGPALTLGEGAVNALGAPPAEGRAFRAAGAFVSTSPRSVMRFLVDGWTGPLFTAVFFCAPPTGPSAAKAPVTLLP